MEVVYLHAPTMEVFFSIHDMAMSKVKSWMKIPPRFAQA
jgi:hypothetical protein